MNQPEIFLETAYPQTQLIEVCLLLHLPDLGVFLLPLDVFGQSAPGQSLVRQVHQQIPQTFQVIFGELLFAEM